MPGAWPRQPAVLRPTPEPTVSAQGLWEGLRIVQIGSVSHLKDRSHVDLGKDVPGTWW